MQSKSEGQTSAEEDVQFILSECARLLQAQRSLELKEFIKIHSQDVGADLTLSDGRQIFCGVAALRRIRDLAIRSLRDSDANGTIAPENAYASFKRIITQRFVEQCLPASHEEVEKAIAAALDESKKIRTDSIHFIPCRLVHAPEPRFFEVGPVRFYAQEEFKERIELLYADYLRRGDNDQHRDTCKSLVEKATHYYGGFSWVGEVKIFQCNSVISEDRAFLAVRGALDVLHVLLGSNLTARMAAGGPRLAEDIRAHLHLDANGKLDISTSRSATSEVGFGDQWHKFLSRGDVTFLTGAAADAIAPVVDPRVKRPLGLRLIDAFSWFGDAAREQSDAARIVKATNALERLLATREGSGDGVTRVFSRRGAAICYGSEPDERLDAIAAQFATAYDIRSDLAHGKISPFAPKVMEQAPAIMMLARRALCCALGLFKQMGLIEKLKSDAELAPWLDNLAKDTKTHELARRGTE